VAEEEDWGRSRRVWLAAVGFCRHAECREDSDDIIIIIIILYAYGHRARMEADVMDGKRVEIIIIIIN